MEIIVTILYYYFGLTFLIIILGFILDLFGINIPFDDEEEEEESLKDR